MSFPSPKIIPRVYLSPKRKLQPKRKRLNLQHSPIKIRSPNRSKTVVTHRESFRKNPSVNPITKRNIQIGGATYNKLVKMYGQPY